MQMSIVWNEIDYHFDMRKLTNGAHTEIR